MRDNCGKDSCQSQKHAYQEALERPSGVNFKIPGVTVLLLYLVGNVRFANHQHHHDHDVEYQSSDGVKVFVQKILPSLEVWDSVPTRWIFVVSSKQGFPDRVSTKSGG